MSGAAWLNLPVMAATWSAGGNRKALRAKNGVSLTGSTARNRSLRPSSAWASESVAWLAASEVGASMTARMMLVLCGNALLKAISRWRHGRLRRDQLADVGGDGEMVDGIEAGERRQDEARRDHQPRPARALLDRRLDYGLDHRKGGLPQVCNRQVHVRPGDPAFSPSIAVKWGPGAGVRHRGSPKPAGQRIWRETGFNSGAILRPGTCRIQSLRAVNSPKMRSGGARKGEIRPRAGSQERLRRRAGRRHGNARSFVRSCTINRLQAGFP